MSTARKVMLICLGVAGLVLVGVGTLVALNWDAVSSSLGVALDEQTERTRTTLFRLGELMSITAELKSEYGTEPVLAYDNDTDGRVLSITLSNYVLPGEISARAHAREIAAFAIGKTTKFREIDRVTVLFGDSGPYGFALEELMSEGR